MCVGVRRLLMRAVLTTLLLLLAGCANAPPIEGIEPVPEPEVVADDALPGVGFCGCYWYTAVLRSLAAQNQANGASADAMPEGYVVDPAGSVTVDILMCDSGSIAGTIVEDPAFAVTRTGAIPPERLATTDTVAFGAIVNSEALQVAFEAIGIPVAGVGNAEAFDEGITGSMRAEGNTADLSVTAVHRTPPTREDDGLFGQTFEIGTHFVDDDVVQSKWVVHYTWTQFYERDGGTVAFGGDTSRFVPGDPSTFPADGGYIVFDGDDMDVRFDDHNGAVRTSIECP